MSLFRTPIFASCCLLALGSACALDDVGDGDMLPGDGPQRIPADDPAVDDRLDALEIVCETTFLISGTFTPGEPLQPEDQNGCWPIGKWSVTTATVDRLGCDPQPQVTTAYDYEVTYDEEASTHNVLFTNAPNDDRVNLKISTAGDSLCHGSMDHFALDGSVWGFRPTLQLDGTLSGIGTYSVYIEDSF